MAREKVKWLAQMSALVIGSALFLWAYLSAVFYIWDLIEALKTYLKTH